MSYFKDIDQWLDSMLKQASTKKDGAKAAKEEIKAKLLESYRNGQSAGKGGKRTSAEPKPRHVAKNCGIKACKAEPTRWIEWPSSADNTFYLCERHAEAASPNDDRVAFLKPDENTIEFRELAVYSCSDECPICND